MAVDHALHSRLDEIRAVAGRIESRQAEVETALRALGEGLRGKLLPTIETLIGLVGEVHAELTAEKPASDLADTLRKIEARLGHITTLLQAGAAHGEGRKDYAE